MMSIQYSSIRPSFQAVLQSRQKRVSQSLNRKALYLREFGFIQG